MSTKEEATTKKKQQDNVKGLAILEESDRERGGAELGDDVIEPFVILCHSACLPSSKLVM